MIADAHGARVLFYQQRVRRNGKWATQLVFSRAWPDYCQTSPTQTPGDKAAIYLQLTVRAGRVSAESSWDGKGWNRVIAKDVPLTGKLTIGVFVLEPVSKLADGYQRTGQV
jgi:hypothetical protein